MTLAHWYDHYDLDPNVLLLPKYIDVLQDALGLTAFMSDACDIETAPYTTSNDGWNKGMMSSEKSS